MVLLRILGFEIQYLLLRILSFINNLKARLYLIQNSKSKDSSISDLNLIKF